MWVVFRPPPHTSETAESLEKTYKSCHAESLSVTDPSSLQSPLPWTDRGAHESQTLAWPPGTVQPNKTHSLRLSVKELTPHPNVVFKTRGSRKITRKVRPLSGSSQTPTISVIPQHRNSVFPTAPQEAAGDRTLAREPACDHQRTRTPLSTPPKDSVFLVLANGRWNG